MNKGIIGAFFIFILSLSALISSYLKFQSITSSKDFLKISFGEKSYCIKKNGEAVGFFKYVLNKIPSPYLNLNGKLNMHFKNRDFPLRFSAEILFNGVGQLTASNINLIFLDFKIVLGSKNPNPINLFFKLEKNGNIQNSFKNAIDGPIEAKLSDSYLLVSENSIGQNFNKGFITSLRKGIFSDIFKGISVVDLNDCIVKNINSSLDLNITLEKLFSLYSFANKAKASNGLFATN